jgi:methylthioribulose-1-phosphate dehydratase
MTAVSDKPWDAGEELQARRRVCELCRQLYELGWASGTGGGFSLRQGERIYVAPSGVPKERIAPEEVFVLDQEGRVLRSGQPSADGVGGLVGTVGPLKLSACTPLFMHAYKLRGAGAVLHSHSQNACLASLLFPPVFRVRGLEMVKGVEGGHVDEVYEVPIIDNMPYEHELSDSLEKAIRDFPRTTAVLVRGHGVYIWGRDWVHTKNQAECYDYLFATAVRLRELGLDPAQLDRRHRKEA